MENNELRDLPQCELLSILNEKSKLRHDSKLDVLGILNSFRNEVSPEILQINRLFPEYTPHDESYHLKHLFHIADKILGEERLKSMNSAELFILTIGLYGHDWGMSVSTPEKKYITSGELIEGTQKEDLCILPDEQNLYKSFLRKNYQYKADEASDNEVPIELWREYIRQTHAFRSAERIRSFFKTIDNSVGESAAKICEGHSLEFEELQNPSRYPASFSVMGESINLRALTIYVRLIDLFDLAEDRTPYVLWKFIAPTNPKSKMEWAKHRALRPVIFPSYQEGRVIQVDGHTDDQDVYAELEDLRVYCEEQLRGSNNILAQMNDSRHKLDLYHINWNIEVVGFEKTSIRFEFDREQMFKILGEQIYHNDQYVFLRELLQNSIDAIRMRREILEEHLGSDLYDFGRINVNIDYEANGEVIVTWQDNGIGMDEYIVSNYLAKVGKSYYRSRDFKIADLKMDPISRFGMGILSCFTVADRIEIETLRDPYLAPNSSPLKIVISDLKRHFRIEKICSNAFKPGTKVRIFINKKIDNNEDKEACFKPQNVVEYLSIVAGFVEFPIIVEEGTRKAIILHPNQQPTVLRDRFGDEFKIFQLNLSYPWSDAILPQDFFNSQEALREEKLDLASDLGLVGYEGVLEYLVPIRDNIDIAYSGELINIHNNEFKYDHKKIRSREGWNYWNYRQILGLSRSSRYSMAFSLYKDGVLIPSVSYRALYLEGLSMSGPLPLPRLIVNLTNDRLGTVNLSRTELIIEGKHWKNTLFKTFINHILNKYMDELLAMGPIERAYKLGRISAFHNIDIEKFWEVFPHDSWPLIFLDSKGEIIGDDWVNISKTQINLFPLHDGIMTDLKPSERTDKWFEELLGKWSGERVLIQKFQNIFPDSAAGRIARNLCDIPIKKFYFFKKINFLHPPWEGNPPLPQKVLYPINDEEKYNSLEDLLEIAVEAPEDLTPFGNNILNKFFKKDKGSLDLMLAESTEFPHPYTASFAYGEYLLNRRHPCGEALLRFRAAVELSKIRKNLPANQLGDLEDALSNFDIIRKASLFKLDRFSSSMMRMFSLAKDIKLLDLGDITTLIPDKNEFVPGTVSTFKDDSISFTHQYLYHTYNIKSYGKIL